MKFNFNYFKHRYVILAVSLAVVVCGIIYGLVTGYTFDIDFKGGTRIQVALNEEYNESDIKDIVESVCSQTPGIQTSSSGSYAITITTQVISEDESNAIVEALQEKYTQMGDATIKNVQASYGQELINTAIISVVISIALLLVYVAVRFRTLGYTAALSAVLALLFDTAFLFAVYGVFKFPINSTFVAVILTIIGYSVNDTIVIYDRIRENRKLVTKSSDPTQVVNDSINQTMSRTVVTSLTTLAAIGIVLIYAIIYDQDTLKQFSIPLCIGIAEGTLSSIFIATNLWCIFDNLIKKSKEKKKTKTKKAKA